MAQASQQGRLLLELLLLGPIAVDQGFHRNGRAEPGSSAYGPHPTAPKLATECDIRGGDLWTRRLRGWCWRL